MNPSFIYESVKGISKRELFAAMAMEALLSAIYSNKQMLTEFTSTDHKIHRPGSDVVSENALLYADALIKELNKE